jgi:hypothetical protein
MIFSFSIGFCVDNDVDNNNGNCVTDAVFEPAPIEISGNFKHDTLLQSVSVCILDRELGPATSVSLNVS